MKLLCTGDLHLGAGAEYGRAPGDRLADQEHVWRRILELAVDENVDGVLFAGDAFEGPTPTSEHYQAFVRPVQEVLQGRIPLLAVSGNGKHDSAMRSTNALQVFDGLGLTVSSTPDVYRFAGCAVATLPWVSPARLVAARGGGDRDEIHAEVAQLLVDIARRGREDCDRVAPGAPAILLGHWSVSGSSLPNGLPVDQLREPVIPIDDLYALAFDHVVMGHIHKAQPLAADSEDDVGFYVGSPMPLNFGEAHTAHGVRILDLGKDSQHGAERNGSSLARGTARGRGQLRSDFAVGQTDGLEAAAEDSTRHDGRGDRPEGRGDARSADVHLSSGSSQPELETVLPGCDQRPRGDRAHAAASPADGFPSAGADRPRDGLARSTFHPIPSRHFVTIDWASEDFEFLPPLAIESADDGAIVRLRYTATQEQQRSIDTADLRRQLIDAGAAVVKIQPDIVRADRARVEGLDEGVGELDALEQWMLAQGIVGVDEPVELAEPTRLLAEAMRTRTRGYLEAAA